MSFPSLSPDLLPECIDALNTLIKIYKEHHARTFVSVPFDRPKTLPFIMNPSIADEYERMLRVFNQVWMCFMRIRCYVISKYPISIDGHNLGVVILDELITKLSNWISTMNSYHESMQHNMRAFSSNSHTAIDTIQRCNKYPSDLLDVPQLMLQYWTRIKEFETSMEIAFNEYYLGIANMCLDIVHYMRMNEKTIKQPRKAVDSLCS